MKHTFPLTLFMLLTLTCGVALAESPQRSAAPEACTNVLSTTWGRAVTPENAWREYPRPQLVRANWTSLNGFWDYAITSVIADEPRAWEGSILVPYPIESVLSRVKRAVQPDQQIWYHRTFTATPRAGFRTLLHFERVDFRASVFVNGTEALDVPHEGGNVPFEMDVTDLVRAGVNDLRVLVWDPTDTHLGGTGKQVLHPSECFFGAASGICGGVWLEEVPATYLADYQVVTDAAQGTVTITPDVRGSAPYAARVTVTVRFGNETLVSATRPAHEPITLTLPQPHHLWSCETPNLYDFDITVTAHGATDRARGYFGLRTVERKRDARGVWRVALNGRFVFLTATLDQGWWPDGLLTPPSEAACRFDVEFHKKAGFNAIRKHIKIEPRAFYAHCDRTGILVLQDIPSWGHGRRQSDFIHANTRYAFARQELKDCVDHLRNHPSIIMWTPYNEGWGQPSADKTRFTNKWLRRYDPTRLINGPSGWNDYEGGATQPYANWTYNEVADKTVYTDCVDRHNYPHAHMLPLSDSRISIAGEFGGLYVPIRGHVENPQGARYPLREENDPSWRHEQQRRYAELMRPLPAMARAGLGGFVYCEAIDQYWELCGFVTFDRALVKLDYTFLRAIHEEIRAAADEAATTPLPKTQGPSVTWEKPVEIDHGEWPRLLVLDDGRWALTYSHRPNQTVQHWDVVLRWSTDQGRTWSTPETILKGSFAPVFDNQRTHLAPRNAQLFQLPANHPVHPRRLILAVNQRPDCTDATCHSRVACSVSDDLGKTWRAPQTLAPTKRSIALEPFLSVLPDGTLQLLTTSLAAPVGIGCFLSKDGGDTWQGPTHIATPGDTSSRRPTQVRCGDFLYLAYERKAPGITYACPRILRAHKNNPTKILGRDDPLAGVIGANDNFYSPTLIQTENFLVLSGTWDPPRPPTQAERVAAKNPVRPWNPVSTRPAGQLHLGVWALAKNRIGTDGALPAFTPVALPLGEATPIVWSAVAPTGNDDLVAIAQRDGEIYIVRGRLHSGILPRTGRDR